MNIGRRIYCCLLLLLACSCSIYAQDVVLRGHITNRTSDSVRITYNTDRLAYYPKEFYAPLDRNGNFSVSFPVPADVYTMVELRHGNHLAELMLTNGDSLKVIADARRFDSSISYTGSGSDIQNFVAQHTLERGRVNQYTMRIRNHIAETPEDYLKGLENEKKEELAFTTRHGDKLPARFRRIWDASFTYYNYFFIEQYPQMHEMQRIRRYTDTIPEANYAVLKGLPDAFDDEYLQVPPYLLYLSGLFETRLRGAGYAVPVTDSANARKLLDSVDKLAYKLLPTGSGEYFIAQSLYARARVQYIERSRAVFAAFRKRWPASQYLPALQKEMDMAERLQAGQPAPDMNVTMADGKQVRLSDLKGKVVYISFWTTWCKQCVGELRMMERKVKDMFANKPVEFVTVSIDEDTATAKLLQQQMGLTGNFTYTTGGWYAPAAQSYGVRALPAYFLVDRNGNFAVTQPPSPQRSTELLVAISKLY
ncbi:hypothetical protein GCM10023093_08290 [Nemorincola caseinilytica]|uniref:Thioredoxin domain-containing protein n=2 Tax=Nemorincola caseinilytica TaxID=2054315 RepID=A0ABP8N9C2_9BACT